VKGTWAVVDDEKMLAIARKRLSEANDKECSIDHQHWSSIDKEDTMLCTALNCGKGSHLMGLR